uniref:Uncharacterized protein n=1 Tax=Rhizophora mucronata TaxID=61149 RepID=A0A2P2M7K5_RHIMU
MVLFSVKFLSYIQVSCMPNLRKM